MGRQASIIAEGGTEHLIARGTKYITPQLSRNNIYTRFWRQVTVMAEGRTEHTHTKKEQDK
jgi:hypothetical protein